MITEESMLQQISHIPLQSSSLYNIYHNNKPLQSNILAGYHLGKELKGISNSTEIKITLPKSCLPAEEKPKTGWLKRLLIDMCLIKDNDNSRKPEVTTTRHKSKKMHSPYSYYKQLYINQEAKNNTKIIDKPKSVISERNTVDASDEFEMTVAYRRPASPYENQRTTHDTIKKNMGRPLNIKEFKKLDQFYQSEIKHIICEAWNADLKTRHKLLGNVVNNIEQFKSHLAELEKTNMTKNKLTANERAEEIITKKKLPILYSAAESIINHRSDSFTRMISLYNNKSYSDKELMIKHNNVMLYLKNPSAMKVEHFA